MISEFRNYLKITNLDLDHNDYNNFIFVSLYYIKSLNKVKSISNEHLSEGEFYVELEDNMFIGGVHVICDDIYTILIEKDKPSHKHMHIQYYENVETVGSKERKKEIIYDDRAII